MSNKATAELQNLIANQSTDTLIASLAALEPRWNTTGLQRHESDVRYAIVSTITARHGIAARVNDLYLDEVDGFTGTELEAIMLALAEVAA